MILIAIDPGAHGGIAIRKDKTVTIMKIPSTPQDICRVLSDVKNLADHGTLSSTFSTTESAESQPLKCYLEAVSGYAGGPGQPGSAMFNFGRSYGNLEGILIALQIPFEAVRPQKWQAYLGVTPAGREKAPSGADSATKKAVQLRNQIRKRKHKNRLKEFAQRLYPYHKLTLDTCDALLILEYALRIHRNEPPAPPHSDLTEQQQQEQLPLTNEQQA